jgi:excisionase family DNA binding protein
MTSAAEQIASKWFTIEEAGIALKLKTDAVRRLILSGDIYGVKIGKEWRVELASIEALFERRRAAAKVALSKLRK